MTIAPPLTEVAFMAQVTQYATLRGWEWAHVRAGRTADSWRTPMSGTMAKGFPDLVLVNVARRHVIFAELKTDRGKLTPPQERVLRLLWDATRYPVMFVEGPRGTVTWGEPGRPPKVDVVEWRPRDWPLIEKVLA